MHERFPAASGSPGAAAITRALQRPQSRRQASRVALGGIATLGLAGPVTTMETDARKKRKKNHPLPSPACAEPACIVRAWGSEGQGDGQFSYARAVAVAPNGMTYVVDASGSEILRFNPSGAFIYDWGRYGNEPGAFNSPQDIDIAPGGDVYVLDFMNSRVQRFSATGYYLGQWGSASSSAPMVSQ